MANEARLKKAKKGSKDKQEHREKGLRKASKDRLGGGPGGQGQAAKGSKQKTKGLAVPQVEPEASVPKPKSNEDQIVHNSAAMQAEYKIR